MVRELAGSREDGVPERAAASACFGGREAAETLEPTARAAAHEKARVRAIEAELEAEGETARGMSPARAAAHAKARARAEEGAAADVLGAAGTPDDESPLPQ